MFPKSVLRNKIFSLNKFSIKLIIIKCFNLTYQLTMLNKVNCYSIIHIVGGFWGLPCTNEPGVIFRNWVI